MSNQSADTRTPHTDALETLGMIHFKEEKRDAIHLAVLPVTAAEELRPGQPIHINSEKWAYPETMNKALCIVDPFLTHPVKHGEKFWAVVKPRRITSLRHVWTHPELPEEPENVE